MDAFLMNPFFVPSSGYSAHRPSFQSGYGPYGGGSSPSPRRGWSVSDVPRRQAYQYPSYYPEEVEEDEEEYYEPMEQVYVGPDGRPLSERDYMLLKRRMMAQKEMEMREKQRREMELKRLKEIERQKEIERLERIKKEQLRKRQQQQQQQQQIQQQQQQQQALKQSRNVIPIRSSINEREEEERKKKQDLNRRRAALVFMFNYAAKKIQRAYRDYKLRQQKKVEEQKVKMIQELKLKQEESAKVLQRAFKRYLEKQQFKQISNKIAKLKELKVKSSELKSKYESQVLSTPVFNPNGTINKKYLEYEDALVKTLIQLDSVSSGGNDLVRLRRKSLIDFVQGLLDTIDNHKQEEKNLMQVDA